MIRIPAWRPSDKPSRMWLMRRAQFKFSLAVCAWSVWSVDACARGVSLKWPNSRSSSRSESATPNISFLLKRTKLSSNVPSIVTLKRNYNLPLLLVELYLRWAEIRQISRQSSTACKTTSIAGRTMLAEARQILTKSFRKAKRNNYLHIVFRMYLKLEVNMESDFMWKMEGFRALGWTEGTCWQAMALQNNVLAAAALMPIKSELLVLSAQSRFLSYNLTFLVTYTLHSWCSFRLNSCVSVLSTQRYLGPRSRAS